MWNKSVSVNLIEQKDQNINLTNYLEAHQLIFGVHQFELF